jgi:transcriptional regulator with XRE-family HTH domain
MPAMPSATLGSTLKRARTGKALSLRDVERRTGIKSGHLSQIETGVIAKPDMAILWELALLYDLRFPELIRRGRRRPRPPAHDGGAARARRPLARGARRGARLHRRLEGAS